MLDGVIGISLERRPKTPASEGDNETLLRLVFSMDFFDKLKTSWTSPLRHPPPSVDKSPDPAETWTLTLPTFTLNNIRLLLFRDCDRRGRKCLYDSHHVIRDKNGKFSYIPTGSGSEMKNLSEYIFGCVPLTSNCGTKRFHKYEGKYIWSQVFSPKKRNGTDCKSVGSSPCKLKLLACAGKLTTSSTPNHADQDQVDAGCPSPSSTFMKNTGTANSLPNIASGNSPMGKCLSLPSKLYDSNQKTLLGLGIMLESSPENKETLGPYLLSISKSLEECSTWFSLIASQAYCSPNTFVQTLYDFSLEIKKVLHSRLVSPLVSSISLVPSWKTLPTLTAELIHLILQCDELSCKSSDRTKIVLVGSSRRSGEVKGLLYLFKLLLLKCNTETDVGIDATTFCVNLPSTKTLVSQTHAQLPSLPTLSCMDTSSSCGSMSMTSSASVSPPNALIQQASFQVHQPKLEEERLQKREYDSGIELELDNSSNLSIMSMRRSISQKFDGDRDSGNSSSGCGSSSDERGRRSRRGSLLPHQYSHEFEEVSFHLGDLGIDSDQSINTLALSEPNLDKLRIYHGGLSRIEPVEHNAKIEKLSLDPIEVKLNFGNEPIGSYHGASSPPAGPHRSITAYCPYCDSIGIVDKFSPLYYIQWIRGAADVTEESFNLMKTFSTSRFILVNLDKSYIRTVNFESGDKMNMTGTKTPIPTSSPSTSLMNNLLHNLHILSRECRETEIEHFLQIQLEFIKKIAYDFGKSWTNPSVDEDIVKKKYSYLNLSEQDFALIESLAKMRFPSLSMNN